MLINQWINKLWRSVFYNIHLGNIKPLLSHYKWWRSMVIIWDCFYFIPYSNHFSCITISSFHLFMYYPTVFGNWTWSLGMVFLKIQQCLMANVHTTPFKYILTLRVCMELYWDILRKRFQFGWQPCIFMNPHIWCRVLYCWILNDVVLCCTMSNVEILK